MKNTRLFRQKQITISLVAVMIICLFGLTGGSFGVEFTFAGTNNTYQSTYDLVQWGYRGNDTFYCIDIYDADWNMLYQAVECGEGLHSYSPKKLNLPPGTYNWKVWSPGGYGENGFQGSISTSNTYQSTYDLVQWGNRGYDTFYCIDIFDANWNMLYQAVECGEGLHSYSPKQLNLPPGTYNWKVWSQGGYGGNGFQGSISVTTSTPSAACQNIQGRYDSVVKMGGTVTVLGETERISEEAYYLGIRI